MHNSDIREKSKACNVPLWKIAEELGVCDMTLTRRMRKELTDSDKNRIFAIIERLHSAQEAR